MNELFSRDIGPVAILRAEGLPEETHLFAREEIDAVHAAWHSRRALLIRGESGTGKSQIAYAVAAVLKSPCIPFVVDSRTEARDLRYSLDGLERLAQAHAAGTKGMDLMAMARFVDPGPLWWAFNWSDAEEHCTRNHRPKLDRGAWDSEDDGAPPPVLLIDEIDKADPSVPNGLLEALGDGRFPVAGRPNPVVAKRSPLVIITSNEERGLPDAFVRRCMTHVTRFPNELELVRRAKERFSRLDPALCEKAAKMLLAARQVRRPGEPKPGQAECFDLLRAVESMGENDAERRVLLDELATYAIDKRAPDQRPDVEWDSAP